jgi:hypothetical protein
MVFSSTTLRAKLREAEQLAAQIQTLERNSEEQKAAIFRWAVVADEATKYIIQAEEQLSAAQLARLKAEVNAEGRDLWTLYRQSEWRLPKFGGPGPGDEPPPRISLGDLLQ